MLDSELYFIKNLRQASPYISKHRGKTVVFYLPSEIVDDNDKLLQFAQDVVLLNNLGIKIIVTLGASLQINHALSENNISYHFNNNIRITALEQIQIIQSVVGSMRSKVESAFNQASSEQQLPPSLISGNWVTAKPKGVIDGVDFILTGALRKINTLAINNVLDNNHICLLTPLAYSSSGVVFNLNTLEQAYAIAEKLSADKLMIFTEYRNLEHLPKFLNIADLKAQLSKKNPVGLDNLLQKSLSSKNAIKRIHLMSQESPSSMLLELFTSQGTGSLIYTDRYHEITMASLDDVSAIYTLIHPLTERGVLIERTIEDIKQELNSFIVAKIDDKIIGCASLYSIDDEIAEIACLVVEPDFQGSEIGKQLLDNAIQQAKLKQHSKIFILTTQTNDWFKEQGFIDSNALSLPKQKTYNKHRNSKVLVKLI